MSLCSLLAFTIGNTLVAQSPASDQSSASRPNIVLIISDDQTYSDYGFMGHPVIETPHLDRLASESHIFTRGYVTTALCCPSVTSIITGCYPHEHGFYGNEPNKQTPETLAAQVERRKHFSTLPQLPKLLAEKGYLSLHTGKYWQGDPDLSGFTDSLGKTGRHGGKSLDIGRKTMTPIYDFIAKAQAENKPFFVWYAPYLPHEPHNPPEHLLKKYQAKAKSEKEAAYFAMVEWLDETCGELLNHLEEKGLCDNTLILYISDNGWTSLQDPSINGKWTTSEVGVRQPILVSWRGKVEPCRDETNLASNVDFAPTVLSAAGIDIPPAMSGINLLDKNAIASRDAIFLEHFRRDMSPGETPAQALIFRGVVRGNWKLIIPTDKVNRPAALYDVKNDPYEEKNLYESNPEIVKELKARLDAWWNPLEETTKTN